MDSRTTRAREDEYRRTRKERQTIVDSRATRIRENEDKRIRKERQTNVNSRTTRTREDADKRMRKERKTIVDSRTISTGLDEHRRTRETNDCGQQNYKARRTRFLHEEMRGKKRSEWNEEVDESWWWQWDVKKGR